MLIERLNVQTCGCQNVVRLRTALMIRSMFGAVICAWVRRTTFRSPGVEVQRLMTDNGCCLPLKTLWSRPLPAWHPPSLYQFQYPEDQRQSRTLHPDLQPWLHRYNWHRPHTALKLQPLISKLQLPE